MEIFEQALVRVFTGRTFRAVDVAQEISIDQLPPQVRYAVQRSGPTSPGARRSIGWALGRSGKVTQVARDRAGNLYEITS